MDFLVIPEPDYRLDKHASEEEAAQHDCTLIVGERNQILLDLDTKEDQIRFKARLKSLKEDGWALKVIDSWDSKSGNQHIMLECYNFPPPPVEQILLLQVALGDDPKHSAIAFRRYTLGQTKYNVLFKPIIKTFKKFRMIPSLKR